MENQLEPQTDREIMLHLDRKIDLFADRLERLTSVLEKLETIKFEGHEERLAAIEKEINQWNSSSSSHINLNSFTNKRCYASWINISILISSG
jgi:hypothetical protein